MYRFPNVVSHVEQTVVVVFLFLKRLQLLSINKLILKMNFIKFDFNSEKKKYINLNKKKKYSDFITPSIKGRFILISSHPLKDFPLVRLVRGVITKFRTETTFNLHFALSLFVKHTHSAIVGHCQKAGTPHPNIQR